MRLIEQKAEIIKQQAGIDGVYKQIEIASRTCYKSEDKITETSAKDFVDRMIKSNHFAMLEHGTIYMFDDNSSISANSDWLMFENNPYSKVNFTTHGTYITTNLREIDKCGAWGCLDYLCEPTEYHEKRITFRLTTSRHIAQELTRHRTFSFAMESQRYCNYNKDKFNNEISFIIPKWTNFPEGVVYLSPEEMWVIRPKNINETIVIPDKLGYLSFFEVLGRSELEYKCMIKDGLAPQQARVVLPNATKTELIMTGFESDWKHFFDLRYFETTGKVDPDMKDLSTKMVEELNKNNIKLWDTEVM